MQRLCSENSPDALEPRSAMAGVEAPGRMAGMRPEM